MDQHNTRDYNLTLEGSAENNNFKHVKQVNSYGHLYMQPATHGQQMEFHQSPFGSENEEYQIRRFYTDASSRASSPGELLLCESTLDASSSDSNAGDDSSPSAFQLNDTGELSSESSFQRLEKSGQHYQRNEVAVNPKSASVCDVYTGGGALVGTNQSRVVIEPGSPESFIVTENQWSRPSSVNSDSRPGSVDVMNETTSPVSFPSADEIVQRQNRPGVVAVRRVPTVIEVGPDALNSDNEDVCDTVSNSSEESPESENVNHESKLPPISYIAPISRTPSPSDAANDATSPNKMCLGQSGLSGLLGGIPQFTIPDSLKLLDNHIESLHQQLIQHSVKMAVTTDAQTHLLMAQQQRHMLETQRLLLQNQQLMMAQMYGTQVNATQIMQMQKLLAAPGFQNKRPSANEVSTKNYNSSKQAAYPNLMQQLLTPPLCQLQSVNNPSNQTSLAQPGVVAIPQPSVNQSPIFPNRSPSPQSMIVKREVVSPVNPHGLLPARNAMSPSNPSFPMKREVITPPPMSVRNSRGPSPIQSEATPSVPLFEHDDKACSLRDILTRPPKVMPPDVRIGAGNSRPVQTVSPFFQRPTAVVAASPHVPYPVADVKTERRGVPMTKIRISPKSLTAPNQSDVVLPPNMNDEEIIGPEQIMSQTSAAVIDANAASPPLLVKSAPMSQPALMNKVPWSQPHEKARDTGDDDYAIRYVATPVKRRRRRPLGVGKKPYCKACSICKETFYKAEDYKDHMNKTHASSFKVCRYRRFFVNNFSLFNVYYPFVNGSTNASYLGSNILTCSIGAKSAKEGITILAVSLSTS